MLLNDINMWACAKMMKVVAKISILTNFKRTLDIVCFIVKVNLIKNNIDNLIIL